MRKDADKIERISLDTLSRFYTNVCIKHPELNELVSEMQKQNVCSYNAKRQKMLTYSELPAFLDAFGISARDMYEIIGIDVPWVSVREKLFMDAVLAIPEQNRVKAFGSLAGAALKIRSPFWEYPGIKKSTPTTRFRIYRNRMMAKSGDLDGKQALLDAVPGAEAVISDNHGFKRLGFENMPAAASALGVPLKWLLGLPSSALCLTKDVVVDNLILLFGQLGENGQCCLLEMARELGNTDVR